MDTKIIKKGPFTEVEVDGKRYSMSSDLSHLSDEQIKKNFNMINAMFTDVFSETSEHNN